MAEVFALVAILVGQYRQSKYAASPAEVDEPYARKLLAALIGRHGGLHDGAGFVAVSEHDGVVTGFIAGSLTRVYEVGTHLAANDLFLVTGSGARAADAARLFDAYVAWAAGNPKVLEIRASWTDAVTGADKIERLYRRKGFTRVGAIWSRAPGGAPASEGEEE